MQTRKVIFSVEGRHLDLLRQALHLEGVPRVVELGRTLVKVRQLINPFSQSPSERATGNVIAIVDYPFTGKSSLAFNAARDWLEATSVGQDQPGVVLVLSPESSREWSRDWLDSEIRANIGSIRAKSLIIIDNLERCLDKANDLPYFLEWLFRPALGYHKLLLCTDGLVFPNRTVQIFQEKIQLAQSQTRAEGTCLACSMEFEGQADWRKIARLRRFIATRRFALTDEPAVGDEAHWFEQNLSTERKDGAQSYLLGLANPLLDSASNRRPRLIGELLAKTKVGEHLRTNPDAFALARILTALLRSSPSLMKTGIHKELVSSIHGALTGLSMTKCDELLENLAAAHLCFEEHDLVRIPKVWAEMVTSLSESANAPALDVGQILNKTGADLHTAGAYYHLSALHLASGNLFAAEMASNKCIDTTLEQAAVKQLATYIMAEAVKCAESNEETDPILDHACQQIENLKNQRLEENQKLSQLLADQVVYQFCDWARMKKIDLWKEASECKRLLDLGLLAHRYFIAAAVDQMIMTSSLVSELRPKVISLLSRLKGGEENKKLDLIAMAKMLIPFSHSRAEIDVILSYLSKAWFSEPTNLPLEPRINSIEWHQTVQLAGALLERSDRSEAAVQEWVASALGLAIRDLASEAKAVATLLWTIDVLKEKTIDIGAFQVLFSVISSEVTNARIFFHLVIAAILWGATNESRGEITHDKYLSVIANTIESVGILASFGPPFQEALSFYQIFLGHIGKHHGVMADLGSKVARHLREVDMLITKHIARIMIVDKIQWKKNYKTLLPAFGDHFSGESAPSDWPGLVAQSYAMAFRFYSDIPEMALAQSITKEASLFSGIYRAPSNPIEGEGIEITGAQSNGEEQIEPASTPAAIEDETPTSDPESDTAGMDGTSETMFTVTSAQFSWGRAIYELQNHRPDRAITILHEYIAGNPQDSEEYYVWYLLGESYSRARDDLSAMNCYRRSRSLNPTFIASYLGMASIYHRLQKYEREISMLDEAFTLEGQDFDVCLSLARAYNAQERQVDAIRFYRLAYSLGIEREQYDELIEELADLLKKQGRLDEASQIYWEAVSRHPFRGNCLFSLLETLEQLAQSNRLHYLHHQVEYTDLVSELLSLLMPFIRDFEDKSKMMMASFLVGDTVRAWKLASELAASPNAPMSNLLNLLHQAFSRCGDESAAAFYYGLMWTRMHRYEEAAEQFDRVIKAYPQDYEAHYYLSLCLVETAKNMRKLHLAEAMTEEKMVLALKESLCAQFLGMRQSFVRRLLGEIRFLQARVDPSLYHYAIYNWEEAYLYQPVEVIVGHISEAKFELIASQWDDKSLSTRVAEIKSGALDGLESYAHSMGDAANQSTIFTILGRLYVQLCQRLGPSLASEGQSEMGSDSLFQKAERILLQARNDNGAGFDPYYWLGKLYWERRSFISSKAARVENLQSAIQAWEKGQELARTTKLPRIQRTIREEMELSIGMAYKELKNLAHE